MSTNCSNLIKTPLSTSIVQMPSSSPTQQFHNHHNHHHQSQSQQPQQQQHPITTTKMGSRRIFSAQFKLQVLDSYRMDNDCKGNQRATARKYGIHRRQIQKWLQCESNLRSSVVLNNNNSSQNNNNNNTKMGNSSAMNGTAATASSRPAISKRIHEPSIAPSDGTISANQSIKSIAQTSAANQTTFSFGKNLVHHHHSVGKVLTTHATQLPHSANDTNAMSLDITRHSVAANTRIYSSNNNNQHYHHENSNNISYNSNAASRNTHSYTSTYKCATASTVTQASNVFALPTTNTGFSISPPTSTTSSSSSLCSSVSAFSAATPTISSFVARPTPHSSNRRQSPVSFAPPQQPLRIVSSTFLMPSPTVTTTALNATTTSTPVEPIPLKSTSFATNTLCSSSLSPPSTSTSSSLSSSSTSLRNSPAFVPYHHQIHPNHYSHVQHPYEMHQMRSHYDLLADVPQSVSIMPTIKHYMGSPHELQLAMPTMPLIAPRAIPSTATPLMASYENVIHTPVNAFYENTSASELYRTSSYLPSISTPMPIQSHVLPMIQDDGEIDVHISEELSHSPIDLTVTARQSIDLALDRPSKPRFSLPSPPVKPFTYNALNITKRQQSINDDDVSNSKPWDLRCSHKRKTDDDIDEGISVGNEHNSNANAKESSSPTPAKVVKLFKPYLLSSDDEEDVEVTHNDDGKKCLASDQRQKDPIIWSSHSFYDSTNPNQPTAMLPLNFLHSPSVNATYSQQNDSMQHQHIPAVPSAQPTAHSSLSSYWLNHGSPVSGYDSASSTFSDCNCNDSTCQTKLASPAPTNISTYSDDYNSPTANSHGAEEVITSTPIKSEASAFVAPITPLQSTSTSTSFTSQQTTKYIVPRRHILEKWSHEEDDELAVAAAQKYNYKRQQQQQNSLMIAG